MSKLIACVPNFSEGTELELVEEIVAAIKTALVVDLHTDPDHNRSVVTMIGELEQVKQAAFDLTERAMQILDVNSHSGAHPFIGVVDVIPFIPVKGCQMKDATDLAHKLGEELWKKLSLPVFFYGFAAKVKERKDLPYVRKGGYAALKREIGEPQRQPDVGRGLHLTAGAVAVGARNYLIAFNINLRSNDPDIALSIARNIRESSGGLPGVRAIGINLDSRGITQVSINIVDHEKTSLKKVYGEVEKWAKEYQVEIEGSELVGLIPKSAVFPEMKEYLRLAQSPRILPQTAQK